MQRTEPVDQEPSEAAREQAHMRIAERLLDELGDKADDHCLTMAYYLVRAGRLADERMVVRFASKAARLAREHQSYYVAGRYFRAAARAGARLLGFDERASLYRQAGDAFRQWSDPALCVECYREAARLYRRAENPAGRADALELLRESLADGQSDHRQDAQSEYGLMRSAIPRTSP